MIVPLKERSQLLPLGLDPPQSHEKRLLQNRDVLCDKKEAERQHLEAEDRQKAEDASQDEQPGDNDTDPKRGWFS